MKHGKRMLIAFVVAVWLCIQAAVPVSAATLNDSRINVKVGVLNNTTYADQDENGNWSGLDIECMIAISQKAGFNIEFIDSSNDPDFLGNLEKGKYDILADVAMTPERENKYLFTDEAIGRTLCTLAVRADDDRWDYGNVDQVAQMKVGVIASYANNSDFRSWCKKHAVTPSIVEYKDMEQMTAALFDGKIDGEVYTAVYDKENSKTRSVMKFLPESFYYAFRKNDTELKNRVDEALSQILVGNVDYLSDLKKKYEDKYDTNDLPFSSSEKEYIAKHPELSVAVISGDEPYYMKDADGKDTGIVPDYYALIAKGTGLKFIFKQYPSQKDAIAAVKNGAADIVGTYPGGIISSQRSGLVLTNSFSTVNSIMLEKSGAQTLEVDSIAVRESAKNYISDNLTSEFPNVLIKTYETAQKCYDAVENGKAKAVLIGLPSATWLINQTNMHAYSIIPMPGETFDICGAVDNDDLTLCSILNKRIAATKNSFAGLVTRDTMPKDDWQTTISRIQPVWIIMIVGILVVLVIGLTWALVLLRRRQKERTEILAAQAETEKQKIQVDAIQRSAEERNRFFANISHDMRTPLNAVINFIRLAQKDGLSGDQQNAYLGKAESSSKLLLDLINDTLTVSKLSGGKLQLQLKPCRFTEIIEEVVSPVREAAEHKKIDFDVFIGDISDSAIMADSLNIEKIFLNLLTNAVRYTPEGGHISYSARQESEDKSKICCAVTVSDDGIGMSKEFLPHLFEPFAQEKRYGYESVGTGLGLSIVEQLVDLMGGTIEVESSLGHGTTFTVRLCFEKAPDAVVSPEHKPVRADTATLAGKKLLLCEDNGLNREIAAAILNDKGVEVISAENGKVGLAIFEKSVPGEFAAILMDVRMPVMDGLETSRAIRALDRPDAKTIPIIAMTADAFADDVEKCIDAGMNAHIAKPIDPERMLATIIEELSE